MPVQRRKPDGIVGVLGLMKRFSSRRDLLLVALPTLLVVGAAIAVGVMALRFAPPSTIRFISGPDGSGYRNLADKYQKILHGYGVKVEVIPSRGALENLEKLVDRTSKVDVGFVQGAWPRARTSTTWSRWGACLPSP